MISWEKNKEWDRDEVAGMCNVVLVVLIGGVVHVDDVLDLDNDVLHVYVRLVVIVVDVVDVDHIDVRDAFIVDVRREDVLTHLHRLFSSFCFLYVSLLFIDFLFRQSSLLVFLFLPFFAFFFRVFFLTPTV